MEKAFNRQKILLQHLQPVSSSSSSSLNHGHASNLSASSCLAGDSHRASGDDVVIVAACRTAQCKSKRGGFKDTLADDLLSTVLKGCNDLNKNDKEPAIVCEFVKSYVEPAITLATKMTCNHISVFVSKN